MPPLAGRAVRRLRGGADGAGAAEHHLMLRDLERAPLGEPLDRSLQSLVGERLQASAAVADKMVVVAATVADGLKPAHTGADVDALYDADLFELLEDAVDARPRHAPAAARKRLFDLERRQRTALCAHQRQQLAAGAAATVAGVGELLERTLGPSLCLGDLLHSIIVSR